MNYDRTIAAIATPIGTGAIGIIRISGRDAINVADKVFHSKSFASFSEAVPNMLYLGNILSNTISESCLGVYFKSPKSYTGEDSIEFYCHGGVRLLNSLLTLILNSGAALADNGEFTKRAFMNGKMALSDAEGVIDMITAESEAAINASYRLMSGKLSSEIKRLNDKLLHAISGLEASLDYPEEMEEDTRVEGRIIIEEVLCDLIKLYGTAERGKVIKYGINVAIIGAPNAGKSSLMNAILQDERAIVSPIAGTTRDTISESIVAKGIKINFIDTAGIRESIDDIERMGVARTFKAIEGADIIIKVIDATTNEIIESNKDKITLEVFNKADLVNIDSSKRGISAKTGEGIEQLIEEIIRFKTENNQLEDSEILTNTRHIESVKNAIEYLKVALSDYDYTTSDCLLIDIRAAYNSLGEIDGSTASEKIVDEIFTRFCVGK